jgi:hypothetical protein
MYGRCTQAVQYDKPTALSWNLMFDVSNDLEGTSMLPYYCPTYDNNNAGHC